MKPFCGTARFRSALDPLILFSSQHRRLLRPCLKAWQGSTHRLSVWWEIHHSQYNTIFIDKALRLALGSVSVVIVVGRKRRCFPEHSEVALDRSGLTFDLRIFNDNSIARGVMTCHLQIMKAQCQLGLLGLTLKVHSFEYTKA